MIVFYNKKNMLVWFSYERSLETIHEEKGISSRFRVSILSVYDLSCHRMTLTVNRQPQPSKNSKKWLWASKNT